MTVKNLPQSMQVPQLGRVKIGSELNENREVQSRDPKGQPQTHAAQDLNGDGFVDQLSRVGANSATYLQDTNFDRRADSLQLTRFDGAKPVSLRGLHDLNHDGKVDSISTGRAGREGDTFDPAPRFEGFPTARVGATVEELKGSAQLVQETESEGVRMRAWGLAGQTPNLMELEQLDPSSGAVVGRHFGFVGPNGEQLPGNASDTNLDGRIDLVTSLEGTEVRTAVDANFDAKVDSLTTDDGAGTTSVKNDSDFDGKIDWISGTRPVR